MHASNCAESKWQEQRVGQGGAAQTLLRKHPGTEPCGEDGGMAVGKDPGELIFVSSTFPLILLRWFALTAGWAARSVHALPWT